MPGHVSSSITPSILSLPPEIIEKVCNLGGPTAALALSRAIPDFTPHAEGPIWHTNHFALPSHYGEYPLIRPEGSDEDEWAREMAKEGEMRARARLAERAKAMLHRGNERRWGYVKVLRIASRPVAVHPLAQILDFSTSTLLLLELQGPPKHVFQDDWRPAILDTLEYSIHMRKMTFPFLVILRVSLGALRYPTLIITLAQSAPQLAVLDIDLQSAHDCTPVDGSRGPLSLAALDASVQPLKALRRMRFICAPACEHSREHAQILLHLVKSGVTLRQLIIAYDAADEPLTAEILEDMSDLADLSEVEWKGPLADLVDLPRGFASMKRLLVQYQNWEDIFVRLPRLDQLQFLHLRGVPYGLAENTITAVKRDKDAASPYHAQKMIHTFAEGLRRSPRLEAIHFTVAPADDRSLASSSAPFFNAIESRVPTGTVRSMRHGDDELLHARLFMPYHTVADVELHGTTHYDPDSVMIRYTEGGHPHLKLLAILPQPVWHDYTASDGLAVPLVIINQMAEAEGLPINWTGRGVNVGDAAWRVLEDWKAQLPPEARNYGIVAQRRG